MKYTIQYGDTLSQLAERFNTSVELLATANGIHDVDKIKAGAEIEVPAWHVPLDQDEGWSALLQKVKDLFNTRVF